MRRTFHFEHITRRHSTEQTAAIIRDTFIRPGKEYLTMRLLDYTAPMTYTLGVARKKPTTFTDETPDRRLRIPACPGIASAVNWTSIRPR